MKGGDSVAINYFDQELCKIQQQFNETFGKLIVCDLKTRQRTILAIVAMGQLAQKIAAANDKDQVRYDIRRFMKASSICKNIFNQIDRQQKERRNHEHYHINKKKTQHVRSQTGR